MKSTTIVVLLTLFAITGFSQTIRTIHPPTSAPLFTSFPSTINCKEIELESIFNSLAGENVNIVLDGKPMFSGIVVSNILKHSNLQYIAVTLPSLNNATLALTKRFDEKYHAVTIIGHIISPKNSDAYELTHLPNGTYEFDKIDLEKLMPTCAMQ